MDGNAAAVLKVIAAPGFTLSGRAIDPTAIAPERLRGTLHEAGVGGGRCGASA